MATIRKSNLIIALTIGLFLGCEQKDCGCVSPPLPLAGDWRLKHITYGLTQKTVTATEAGYSETVSFTNSSDVSGTYRQVRNGIPVQASAYALSFSTNLGKEGLIYFQPDSAQQSFRIVENKLYLSERGSRGTVVADGSTYEYQRE